MLAKRALNVASAILALLIMAFLVWEASDAAFTAQTSEDGTGAAAELVLTDDGFAVGPSASATFSPVLFPGQESEVACIDVTYSDDSAQVFSGSSPTAGEVRFYLSALSNTDGGLGGGPTAPLSEVLEIRVDEVASCDPTVAVLPGTATFSGTLADLVGDYASDHGNWTPAAAGDTQSYAVQLSFPAGSEDALQGDGVSFTLTWEVQTP